MLPSHEDKIFWGRSLYYILSLTSRRDEGCKRRMRSPLRYGVLSPTPLLGAFTDTIVSLLPHPCGSTSLLLPSLKSSPSKAGLTSQTISKLTQGRKILLLPQPAAPVSWTELLGSQTSCRCTRKIRWRGTERKQAVRLAWIWENFILRALKWSLQQGTCALKCGQAPRQHPLMEKGVSYRGKAALVQRRIVVACSQSFFPF